MDEPVNVAEAKARFSALLDRAASGEEIVISKAGKPVARLMPLEKPPKRPFGIAKHWPKLPTAALLAPMDEEDLRWAEGYYQTPEGLPLNMKADRTAKKRKSRKPRT
jgi:prevent-host-death family protein